ncbi:hypothetical protein GCM10010267_35250 [Streptomyces griseorubens]|nr:hypothetical protein GCM10010267_35250 [Streptomyces griseorubens]
MRAGTLGPRSHALTDGRTRRAGALGGLPQHTGRCRRGRGHAFRSARDTLAGGRPVSARRRVRSPLADRRDDGSRRRARRTPVARYATGALSHSARGTVTGGRPVSARRLV